MDICPDILGSDHCPGFFGSERPVSGAGLRPPFFIQF